jgi:hypothetical protein
MPVTTSSTYLGKTKSYLKNESHVAAKTTLRRLRPTKRRHGDRGFFQSSERSNAFLLLSQAMQLTESLYEPTDGSHKLVAI